MADRSPLRRGRRALLAGCLTLAVVLPVVASPAAATVGTLSKKRFVRAGDDVCRQANVQIVDISNRAIASWGGVAPNPQQLAAFVEELVPVFNAQVDGLAQLDPPKADRKTIKTLLATIREEGAVVRSQPQILVAQAGGVFPKSAKLARKYGFKICGTPYVA